MSPRQKMVLEMITRAATADSIAYCEAIQAAAIKENIEKHGVNIRYWDDAMLDTFRKAWAEVATEMAAKDAYFKTVYDDLKKFRAEYRYWQSVGFLPRPKPKF